MQVVRRVEGLVLVYSLCFLFGTFAGGGRGRGEVWNWVRYSGRCMFRLHGVCCFISGAGVLKGAPVQWRAFFVLLCIFNMLLASVT